MDSKFALVMFLSFVNYFEFIRNSLYFLDFVGKPTDAIL